MRSGMIPQGLPNTQRENVTSPYSTYGVKLAAWTDHQPPHHVRREA
jgi:hypothetical protein